MVPTPHFPFRLTATGEAEATINAADSHVLEVQAVLSHTHAAGGDGDVLAVVRFDRELEPGRACGGKPWSTLQLRMASEKLKALGSVKINDMFELRHQERVRRRLGFALVPPGVEYVLDFTPPSEGPELADLTAALWLPKMVKLWFLAGLYIPEAILESSWLEYHRRPMGDKAAGAILTLGHDDGCRNQACLDDITQWRADPGVPGIFDEDPFGGGAKYILPSRRIEDYCRIRHRVAIARLLRAINGENLLLNSAPRLWTVAQVAIHLEVPQVVVDPITQWLIAPPNTKFIEICPEKAFQLAYALKIPSVLIASFRILVSEHAVDCLATPASPRRPQTTWAQRQRDDYGDFPSDPVEYAGKAFADRISGVLSMLQSDQAFNSFSVKIGQWEALKNIGAETEKLPTLPSGTSHPLRTAYVKLANALTVIFHRNLDAALKDVYFGDHLMKLMAAQRKHYIPEREGKTIFSLYHNLNDKQKALTSLFWSRLKNTEAFGSFSESSFQGRELWRVAKDFNTELNAALSTGALDIESLMNSGGTKKPIYEATADFDLAHFIEQLFYALRALCDRVLDRGAHDANVAFFLSDHLLLSLNENELNYLPIWADGLDDGSGGVFQDAIPPAEMGPSEPGPAYHTGYTVGTDTTTDYDSTAAPSDLGIGDLDIHSKAGDTVRSMDAQQSVTTGPARHQVVALSEAGFESDSSTFEKEYADARFAQPAQHQAVGQALASYAEGEDTGDVATTACDEDVAWSDIGSEMGAGLVAPADGMEVDGHNTTPTHPVNETLATGTNTNGGGTAAVTQSGIDDFGLSNDEDMDGADDDDDDDDDDTSTLDGSEYDWI
ncbi:hypothetical protein B0T14DRAFT_567107 [Immersiella caudata]|uniref:Uncharacterized protein n=1 Tax=Immersiella caudata TaxID=314043 RepID=A0AA39WRW5_9PEZI|nr:hypothetical protein B0T14DRAFT_567107 [Immersiella caudata]